MGSALHCFNRWLSFLIILLSCAHCRAQTAVPSNAPSIAVTEKIEQHRKECVGLHCPSYYFTRICTWTSTNATNVSVVGKNRNDNLEAEGTIELGMESYLFIASGPGGIAVQPVVGGRMLCTNCKKGPKPNGPLRFRFQEDFNSSAFDEFAYKSRVTLKRTLDFAIQGIVDYLQSLGYSVPPADRSKIPNGAFIYTSNYADSQLLQQSPEDRRSHGELKRQAAVVVLLSPKLGEPGLYDLWVLSYVVQNHPLQDDTWARDPDGYQMARPLCKSIADTIAKVSQ
jgi:hypothetical protein